MLDPRSVASGFNRETDVNTKFPLSIVCFRESCQFCESVPQIHFLVLPLNEKKWRKTVQLSLFQITWVLKCHECGLALDQIIVLGRTNLQGKGTQRQMSVKQSLYTRRTWVSPTDRGASLSPRALPPTPSSKSANGDHPACCQISSNEWVKEWAWILCLNPWILWTKLR